MGKVDRATKSYLTQSSVFADIFNFYLYEGQQVIDPGQLRELDPAELSMPYGTDRKGEPVQRYRDLFKALSAMEDQRAAYLLLGIESQDEVHYAAPVRNLLYDALQYARQVEETARNHREQKDYKGRDRGEFLSGFYREDKLLPVITLVVFFSPKEWDGPRSLREMMAPKDVVIRSMLPDYQLHLVSPAELSKADFGKFHTSLGDVLEFIKYSMDKDKLVEWLEGEKQDLMLGQKEVEVLNACVNADLRIQPEEEGVKMCKAIQDWKAEWQREMAPILMEQLRKDMGGQIKEELRGAMEEELRGEVKEELRGAMEEELRGEVKEELRGAVKEELREEVTEQVTKQVTESNQLFSLKNVMRNLHLTAEQAGAVLEIPEADMERLMQKL